jgi:mRNA-degrading endonuclease RelE of RelBE toxin-antitoxin system
MNFTVELTSHFERQAKHLLKKYASLDSEITSLINSLKLSPYQGTPMGKDCYKIRLAIASKGKGKSGGARVITYVKVVNFQVYLLSI